MNKSLIGGNNIKIKFRNINIVLVIIASICFIEFLFIAKNVANAEINYNNTDNQCLVLSKQSDNGDPYYGTKEYWINQHSGSDNFTYNEDEEFYPGKPISGDVYVTGYNIIECNKEDQPGLIVEKDCNLIFVDDATLEIRCYDVKNNQGGAPGISLEKGNSLNIYGKGTLIIKGPSSTVEGSYVSGGDATDISIQSNISYNGCNGKGGDGSGGFPALIGTNGGYGSNGGPSILQGSRHVTNPEDEGWTPNDANDGVDSAKTNESGELTISGNLNVVLEQGNLIKQGTVKVGNCADEKKRTWTYEIDLSPDWHARLGSAAGGGQGGYGFKGAFIGTGGVGGAGGGAGGQGGQDYNKWSTYHCYPNGGGGGAGMGSFYSYGGKANTDAGDCKNDAKDGNNFDPSGSYPSGGDGGTGAGGGKGADATGGKGGKGGTCGHSGNAGNVYMVPSDIPSNAEHYDDERNINWKDYQGKESARYLSYPQNDCYILLHDSLSEDGYIYQYDDKAPVHPEFDVIYGPTGAKLDLEKDPSRYTISWIDDDKIGTAELIVKGVDNLSTTSPTLGKTLKTGGGEVHVKYVIANVFKIKGIDFSDKVYDGESVQYHALGTPKIVDVNDKTIEGLSIDKDVRFDFYSWDDVKEEWTVLDKAPSNLGVYKVECSLIHSDYNSWKCVDKPYYFIITEAPLWIDKESEGYTLTKTYDGNINPYVQGAVLTGSVNLCGVVPADINKIDTVPKLGDFPNENQGTYSVSCHLSYVVDKEKYGDILKNYKIKDNYVDVTYIINKREVAITNVVAKSMSYEKATKEIEIGSVEFSGLESVAFERNQQWKCSGEITDGSLDVGLHQCACTVDIISNNFIFQGGESSTTYTDFTCEIHGVEVNLPQPISKEFTYNGEWQTFDVEESGSYTVEGNKGKDPGSYTAVYTLCEGKEWKGLPESERYKPYSINWTIKKKASFEYDIERITVAVGDNETKEYALKLKDRPNDFNILNETINISDDDKKFIYLYSLEDNLLKFQLSEAAEAEKTIKFIINFETDFYQDSILEVYINLVDKYNAIISDVSVESKTYDQQQVFVVADNIKILIEDTYALQKDVTNKFRQHVKYEYFQLINGEYVDIGSSAPKNSGDYYCAALVDNSFSYISAKSQNIYFSIYKDDKIKFNDVAEDHCYAIKDPNYSSKLDLSLFPLGEKYEISVGKTEDRYRLIDGEINIDNQGNISMVLNTNNLKPGRDILVAFNVDFQNYNISTISYCLNIVDKTSFDMGGIELSDIEYNGDYLNYTGEFYIKLGDEDYTEEFIKLGIVKIIYSDYYTGEIYTEPQVNAGTYNVKIVIDAESELYKGESPTYVGTIHKRQLTGPTTATVYKDYDGNTSIPEHYKTDNLEIGNIIEKDQGEVFAHLIPEHFSTPDAQTYEGWSDVVLEGDAAKNYKFFESDDLLYTKYQINPRRLTIKDVNAIEREYDPDNYSVNLGVTFDNVVEGESPVYAATGHLLSNDVSDENLVDEYTVTFEPGNYAFWDGKSVWSITIIVDPEKDPLFAKITKAEPLKFEDNYGQLTYSSAKSSYEGKLDLNVIPSGQLPTITFKETSGNEDILNPDKEITVTNTGVVTIPLRELTVVDIDKKLTVTFNVDFNNYKSSLIYYELTIVNKKEVTITGVVFQNEKTYDGDVAYYNPDKLSIKDEDGNDLTEELRQSIRYKYFDKNTRETTYEAQWCVGDYEIILYIDYDNEEYKGEATPSGIKIIPRPIHCKTEEITIAKDYDGTTDLSEPIYNIELDEHDIALEEEKTYLKAKANVEKYPLPDVGEWTKDCGVELYWDGPTKKYLNNYVLYNDTISAIYSITPRNITIKEAAAVSRTYDPDNINVDIDVVFENAIRGSDPYYKAIGIIEKPDASESTEVLEYTVTLDPEDDFSNQTKGDYAFLVGDEQVKEITVDNPQIFVEIQKSGHIEIDNTTEFCSYAIDDMNYCGQLNLDKIPAGLDYEISLFSFTDPSALIDSEQISVTHDGQINIVLNRESLKPGRSLTAIFNVSFDNYNTTQVFYELNFIEKKDVEIGGITILDKEYDGDYLGYEGDFYIKCGEEDLTHELAPFLVFNYFEKNTGRIYNDAQVNAGDYDITLTISDNNQYYRGASPIYHGTIYQREVYPSSSISIIKEYDGNTNLPQEYDDEVILENIIDADKDKVFASLLPEGYTSPDVCSYTSQCDVNLYGASSLNYVLTPGYVMLNYQITQRIISVNSATGVDRVYDPNNYNADINVIFDNVVSSSLPEYKAVGYLEDNNVSDNVIINKYTVTLNPENVSNSILGNYAFWDGQKKVSEITIEDKPAYMKITKAPAIIFDDTSETYAADSQKLDYKGKLNLNAMPEGQKIFIGINSIDDPFSIIDNNNISVDNFGNVNILLNKDSMDAGRSLTVVFDVVPWNYESSTITYHLSLVGKMFVEFSGIEYQDKTYDAEPLVYSGDLKITHASEDVTDLVRPYVIIAYNKHDGLHKNLGAPVDSGTYDIVFYISDECESYTGRSDTYTASINPRRIEVKNAEAVGREYDFDNHNVEVHADFDNVIPGHIPTYSAIGYMENNDASETAVVDQYTVTLDPVYINNAEADNYVFFDGQKETKEITITDDPIYVEISKNSDLPAIFITEDVSYVDKPGVKTYTFNFENFPEGMLDENTRFYKDSTVDKDGIINDWSVESINGQITLDITNKPNIDSTSQIFIRTESNNYENSNAQLNVSVKNSPEAPIIVNPDNGASTFDYTYIMLIALFVMVLLGCLFCMIRLYGLRNSNN